MEDEAKSHTDTERAHAFQAAAGVHSQNRTQTQVCKKRGVDIVWCGCRYWKQRQSFTIMSLCKRLVDGNGLCQPQQLAYHAIQPDTNPPPDSRVCEMTHPMRSNARGDRAQTSFDTMPPTCIISTNNSRQFFTKAKKREESIAAHLKSPSSFRSMSAADFLEYW